MRLLYRTHAIEEKIMHAEITKINLSMGLQKNTEVKTWHIQHLILGIYVLTL